MSPATSVHPSDSISQQNQSSAHAPPVPPASHISPAQPATRPAEYPFDVLWLLEDCRDNPIVGVTESNKSRPAMERAIRHSDGRMITDSEWNAIKASARMIKYELHQLPAPQQRLSKERWTKMYYRTNHPMQWQAAITKLETMQPLLQLCASHWKADHVLGNILLASRDHNNNADESPKSKQNRSRDKIDKRRREKGKRRERREQKDETSPDDLSEHTLLTHFKWLIFFFSS